MKMKVVFFADDLQEHTIPIKAELSKTLSCFESNNSDEMSQVYQQSGKFAIFFGDPHQAGRFMQRAPTNLSGLDYKVFCYINKNQRFKPESQKILDQLKINIFMKKDDQHLIKSINDYFSDRPAIAEVDEIQFIMPGEEE